MSFSFSFDITTQQVSLNVDGVLIQYNFDGKTIKLEGKVGTTQTSNVMLPVATTNSLPLQKQHIGVTNYIRSVMLETERMSNIFICKPYQVIDMIPMDELNMKYSRSVFPFINTLHQVSPALDGVCIESILYLALQDNIAKDIYVSDEFNYNNIYHTELIKLHNADDRYNQLVSDIINTYSMIDLDYTGTTEIVFSKVKLANMNKDIISIILYIASYAYINIEKRGFPIDNYTCEHITKYCHVLIDNITSLENLIEYIKRIAKFICQIDNTAGNAPFKADVPIKDIITEKYIINGNVDLLHVSGNNNASVFDIKCCKRDDNYRDADWPRQLNLYAKGLMHQYNITKLYIVNIFTNHLLCYNVADGIRTIDLD